VKSMYNVLKLFVVKEEKGLGRHLECKKCGAKFCSLKDACLHAVYHLRSGDVSMDFFKNTSEDIKPRKKEEKKEEKVAQGNALLTRWLK